MQYKFSQIALWSKVAATVLSTPPESPRITRSAPILALISATVVSTKASGVHV